MELELHACWPKVESGREGRVGRTESDTAGRSTGR